MGYDGRVSTLPAPSAVRAVARAETFLTQLNLGRFTEIYVYGGPKHRRRVIAKWDHGATGWVGTGRD